LPAAIILSASLRYTAIEQGVIDNSSEPALLTAIARIQKEIPGESETLPAYVNLLARAGKRDEAIAVARAAAANRKRYDPSVILRLVAASRAHKLGIEDELQNVAEDDPNSPRVALAR